MIWCVIVSSLCQGFWHSDQQNYWEVHWMYHSVSAMLHINCSFHNLLFQSQMLLVLPLLLQLLWLLCLSWLQFSSSSSSPSSASSWRTKVSSPKTRSSWSWLISYQPPLPDVQLVLIVTAHNLGTLVHEDFEYTIMTTIIHKLFKFNCAETYLDGGDMTVIFLLATTVFLFKPKYLAS